jgi:glycosyltransferase involved in cell wall biosynthesis
MNPLRLLWVTERYPPAKGGMAVSCLRQVRGLRKRGFLIDVAVLGGSATEPAVRPTDGGTDLYFRRSPAMEIAPNMAWTAIHERHARHPYHCAVGFGASWAGFNASTFAAWLGIPSLVLVRGNDLDRDWFLPRRGGWVREAFSRASAIGAVSQEKADRIAALCPGKPVLWTPNSVDTARWELLDADLRRRDEVRSLLQGDSRRIFGLFGELKFKKRIPFWLEAVRDAGLLASIALLVVGNADEETARILNDPAIAPRSMRLPFCPPDELAALYSACDFIAIPSAFEGMPNVLLEAMACGAPPVASNAGAMASVVDNGITGFLFAAENRDEAGRATRLAVELPRAELDAMSARARATVAERFTPAAELDALTRLIQAATAG